jgi:SOS-response transcriptional repressor LexA
MGEILKFQKKKNLRPIQKYGTSGELPVSHEILQEFEDPTDKFIFQVNGNSMEPLIMNEDKLLVDQGRVKDKPVSYFNGRLVITCLNSEYQMARLVVRENVVYLVRENKEYPEIQVKESDDFILWGQITRIIRDP